MIVVARKQHGARGGARWRRVELRKELTCPGKFINGWSSDIPAIATEVSIAQVIGNDQQNIGAGITLAEGGRACGTEKQEKWDAASVHYRMYEKCTSPSAFAKATSDKPTPLLEKERGDGIKSSG